MKKILIFLMMLVLLTGCAAANSTFETNDGSNSVSNGTDDDVSSELLSGIYTADIVIEDYGTITVEMDADQAPITVTNFVKLAKSGFYDGVTFHRIIDGFMMQGGDPTGTGAGGAEEKIFGEFAANGFENKQSHVRGAISMARARDLNSASSQFFIMHKDALYLDGQYACFGYVTAGMEIVDAICANTPVIDDNGTVLPEDQPVMKTVTVH